jgi:hypothetical protein
MARTGRSQNTKTEPKEKKTTTTTYITVHERDPKTRRPFPQEPPLMALTKGGVKAFDPGALSYYSLSYIYVCLNPVLGVVVAQSHLANPVLGVGFAQ